MLVADNGGAFPTGEVAAFAWPGGYPIFYLMGDSEVMCPACVNAEIKRIVEVAVTGERDRDWDVAARDVNWEDAALFCCHCGKRIPSAYAEDSAVAEDAPERL